MAFTAKTLKGLKLDTIRELNDFGEEDWLNGAINDSVTTIVVTDAAFKQYKIGTTIEIDEELMRVTASAISTSVSVRRGVKGTTAAAHVDGEIIRISPKYTQAEIKTYLNTCLESELERDVVNDATTTGAAETYLYDLPTGITEDTLRAVYFRSSATDATARTEDRIMRFDVNRGQGTAGVDQIEFGFLPPVGKYIKYVYRGNFTFLTDDTDTCDLPTTAAAHRLPVLFACSNLLRVKDAHRLKRDRNAFPEGATPMTARKNLADWYVDEFNRIRRAEYLEPTKARTRRVR